MRAYHAMKTIILRPQFACFNATDATTEIFTNLDT